MTARLLQYRGLTCWILCIALMVGAGCRKAEPPLRSDLVDEWYDLALMMERYTPGFKMPVAARAHAYIAIGAWETARPFLAEPDDPPPLWSGPSAVVPDDTAGHHLLLALNAGYHAMFRHFFLTTPQRLEQQQDSLYQKWVRRLAVDVPSDVVQRSMAYGESMAREIIAWAATDSVGHMSQLHNYDKDYIPPPGDAYWTPCEDFPTPALLPHWGEARTFVVKADAIMSTPPPPLSADVTSPFYTQALEILSLYSPLSMENRWIGEFWSDDQPGLTFTASGRWMSIARQMLREDKAGLRRSLLTYLTLGVTLNDAMVACWHAKYTYNLLRPETYIRRVFQPDWRPIIHTPPFPGYPAGHAMAAMAAAEVLTALFGENHALTDRSHEGRTEFQSKPRSFANIRDLAFENAYSRIALGVHFRMDCDEGTRLGAQLGRQIRDQYLGMAAKVQ